MQAYFGSNSAEKALSIADALQFEDGSVSISTQKSNCYCQYTLMTSRWQQYIKLEPPTDVTDNVYLGTAQQETDISPQTHDLNS